MPGIPSPVLDKKGVCLVHDLELEKKKKKHPMYPVQYLCSKTTTKVPDPEPTAKLVRIMAQDLVQKKKKKNRSTLEVVFKNIQICVTKNGK